MGQQDHSAKNGQSAGAPHKRRLSLFSNSSTGGEKAQVSEEVEVEVDWLLVLTSLQREKKRSIARKEQQYVNRSLFCLQSSNTLRERFIRIVEWDWFNRVILFAILCNCVFLILEDPVCNCVEGDCTEAEIYTQMLFERWSCVAWKDFKELLSVTEIIFTVMFTLEMICKIVARGFILHKHAYLRDSWNWIDFIVVVASIASLLSTIGPQNPQAVKNVQVLRTVRVLRPLRTMTRIKGMRPLINTFVGSFKNLGNVVSLLLFFFVVFGILGVDLLGGKLRGRCYFDPQNNNFTEAAKMRLESQQTPYIYEVDDGIGTRWGGVSVCTLENSTSRAWSGATCDLAAIDGVNYNLVCSAKRWCKDRWCDFDWNDNPYNVGAGYVSYDNIGQAFLAIFQVLTNEGWSDLLYSYQDGYTVWFSRIFHSSWVVLGSFFVIQLALAVLADSFVQAQEDAKTEREREALHDEAILRRSIVEESKKAATPVKQGVLHRLISGKGGRGESSANFYVPRTVHDIGRSKNIFDLVMVKTVGLNSWANFSIRCARDIRAFRARVRQLVTSKIFARVVFSAIILNTIIMMIDLHDQFLYEDQICKQRCDLDPSLPAGIRNSCVGPLFNGTFDADGQGGGMKPFQTAFCFLENDAGVRFPEGSRYQASNCSSHKSEGACIQAIGGSGERCFWFPSGPDYRDPGVCKMSLYNSTNFAKEAEVGWVGRIASLSLRQICGDVVNAQCMTSDASRAAVSDQINVVLTCFFIGEMLIKWVGLGILEYFEERFNQFDFLVVTSSVVELIITSQSETSNGSAMSSLRGMRLFRLFKLARSWKQMRKILNTLAIALGNLSPLTIVWVMFMYIFALLSMQFFGGRFKHSKTEVPRSNFDTFFPSPLGHGAFIIIFQIITTENWNTILYNSIMDSGPWASLLTIAVVTFGNYIIMNLFISILLQGFDSDEDEDDQANGKQASHAQRMLNGFRVLLGKVGYARRTRERTHPTALTGTLKQLAMKMQADHNFDELLPEEERDDGKYVTTVGIFKRPIRIPDHKALRIMPPSNRFRRYVAAVVQHSIFENIILVSILITSITLLVESPSDSILADPQFCPQPPLFLNCSGLPPGQTDQINCARHEEDKTFGRVWEPCNSPNHDMVPDCCGIYNKIHTFLILDELFTVVFLIEMMLKLIVDGVVLHDHAYFRNAWNWLDFSIVIISVLSSFGGSANLKTLKTLRAVRALRPLRVIKRNPGLKVAVVCLLSSIPAMFNVIIVVLLWFTMYAMLGVQLFKGTFYRCYDRQQQRFYGTPWFPAGSMYTQALDRSGEGAVPTIIECVSAGNEGGLGTWQDKYYSFNSYPQALLTLFEMATTEGWMDVMATMVDGVAPGVTPIPNQNPQYAWYCAFHIVIGAFVLLNLIVGSVINNYNRIKSLNDGVAPFTTPEQHEWQETRRIISQLKPRVRRQGPANAIRHFCFRIIQTDMFEGVITVVILGNVLTLMMKTYNQDDCFTAAIFWCNVGFLFVFVAEVVIKLLGLGPRWYFLDPWNLFDFIVVGLSISMLALDGINGDWSCGVSVENRIVQVPGLSMLRVFRIARVFRLVRRLRGLRQMIETLIVSLPSLANIAALLALILMIFSVLGVSFFYNVNRSQDVYQRMSDNANYGQFDSALWLLHRQTTGEAWNGFMYYCAEGDLYLACDKSYYPFLGDGCGSTVTGILYHVLWQLFGTYVMMQLFTAVIIENFHELARGETSVLPMHKLAEFVDVWTELDPDACQYIHVEKVSQLIIKLSPPMGLKNKTVTSSTLMQVIKDLAIPIRPGNTVSYKETFVACVKRVMDAEFEDDEEEEGEEEELEQAAVEVVNRRLSQASAANSADPTTNSQGIEANVNGHISNPGEPPNPAGPQENSGDGGTYDPSPAHDASHTEVASGEPGSNRADDGKIPPEWKKRRVTAAEDFAARSVQTAYRAWREKRLQVHKAMNRTTLLPLNGCAKDIQIR